MIRFRDKLTWLSRLRYLIWRTGVFGREIAVQLASGQRIVLSGFQYELGTAYEIFVAEIYRYPKAIDRTSVRRIIDVGSNVGHSIVYWAGYFPEAQIDAFEPHPAHLARLKESVVLNGLSDRVTVHAAAAGTAKSTGELVDLGTASAVLATDDVKEGDGASVVPIQIVDFFEEMGNARIDLLKLDCEGAEFELLMDPRFAQLNISSLVMEWHETPAHPMAERDLCGRLRELGWELEMRPDLVSGPLAGTELTRAGILWAFPAAA
jgi:FkbM family methyltransferase